METLKDAKIILLVSLIVVVSICTWIFKSTMADIKISVNDLNRSVSELATEVRVGSQANKINKESIIEIKTELGLLRSRVRKLEIDQSRNP